jgi:hypothetical protein
MNLYQWLCLLGVQGAITTIISIVITRKMNKAESKAEQARIRAEEANKTAEKVAKATSEGVKALLKDRLLQGYKHYINNVGWADSHDRDNMKELHAQYHALGGNGDMNDLRRTFRHLPTVQGGPPTEVSEEK